MPQEVMKYKEAWEELTRKMGYWVDLEHPYITYENKYIESCWWLLKQFMKSSCSIKAIPYNHIHLQRNRTKLARA
jgi:isoleucyl-tRNA synthetase